MERRALKMRTSCFASISYRTTRRTSSRRSRRPRTARIRLTCAICVPTTSGNGRWSSEYGSWVSNSSAIERRAEAGPETVTSATVAEAVLAIWRERPHQAKFRRREHFGKLYEAIFKDLNAAQAVLATLIYRMVEGKRREGGDNQPVFLPYVSHHIAMLVGRELSRELQLPVEAITHRSFARMKAALDTDGGRYYALAIDSLRNAIRECYGNRHVSLQQLAATFPSR